MTSIGTRWGCACLCALAWVSSAVGAAPPIQDWAAVSPGGSGDSIARFGSNSTPQNKRALAVDVAGNSYVTGNVFNGSNDDYLTQKFDANGVLLWSARYNGPGNGNDQAYALALDGAGDVVVTGQSIGSGTDYDYATLKYAGGTGAPVWPSAARYNGPDNGDDRAYALALDGAGDVMVTGYSFSSGTGQDYATLKYAGATGAPLWTTLPDNAARYNGPGNSTDVTTALALDAAGDVVVTGYSFGSGTGFDYSTLKYAGATGAPLWTTLPDNAARYNGPGNDTDAAYALALDGAGDVVATGYSQGSGTGDDYATLKYAGGTGAPLWANAARYNGPGNGDDRAYTLAIDSAGGVVVTGRSSGSGSGFDYATLKYAGGTGASVWANAARYNGPGNSGDQASALALDGAGDVVVTGYSGTVPDYATLKYAGATGAPLWTTLPGNAARYNGPGNGFDRAYALALDGAGDVRVAGTRNGSVNEDFGIIRYAGADGAQMWVASEGTTTGLSDRLGSNSVPQSNRALAVEAAGNSYVTGSVFNGSSFDYLTQKFDANGVLLWSARYNGPPGDQDDFAYALALDGAGDVVVTGYSFGSGTGQDYATLKYAGGTGAPVWANPARYNGPGNGDDRAYALALDSAGDVVVTGYSQGSGTGRDYATLKYAGGTGAPVWPNAARYNGPGNSSDVAYALALDGAGDVVVTGYSPGSGTGVDYATLKYAGATGAPLWTTLPDNAARYNGPGNGTDVAYALALDSAGDVVATGYSQGSGTGDDYATLKYAGGTGAPLWATLPDNAARYNGPINSTDQAYALALDGAGDVVVTGYSFGSGTGFDYATLKYAGGTGASVWANAARYNGPGNSDDQAYALALDSAGDVMVTGYSYGSGTGQDYATLKYAGADGTETWPHRYDGGASSSDRGYALVVAPDASLRIAGTATTPQGERTVVLKLRDNLDIFADSFETLTPVMLSLPAAEQTMAGQK